MASTLISYGHNVLRGFFYGLLSLPFLALILVTTQSLNYNHVANYERSGLWSTESPSFTSVLAAELAIHYWSETIGVGADDAFALLIKRELVWKFQFASP